MNIEEGQIVKAGQALGTFDQYSDPIIAESDGYVHFEDVIVGSTLAEKIDLQSGKTERTITDLHLDIKQPRILITDEAGNVISWSSAGALGYKGSRKSTPFAAQQAGEAAGKAAVDNGMKTVAVNVKGPGPGREAAVRALQIAGLDITMINDVTPIPHNGCRPPKRPRG